MLLTGIAVITLLATLARRELSQLEAQEPSPEFVKERPAPISKGLHKLRGSSTSVDFRHIRNLSKTLTGRIQVEPPSPIAERTESNPFVDYQVMDYPKGAGLQVPSKFGAQRMARNTPK